jgi:hypothetical protein
MYNSLMADELINEKEEPESEKLIVTQALEFYRKHLKTP